MHNAFHTSDLKPFLGIIKWPTAVTDHVSGKMDVPIVGIINQRTANRIIQYAVVFEGDTKSYWVPASKLELAHHLIIKWEDSLNTSSAVTASLKRGVVKHPPSNNLPCVTINTACAISM